MESKDNSQTTTQAQSLPTPGTPAPTLPLLSGNPVLAARPPNMNQNPFLTGELDWLTENCLFRSAMMGVMGGGMGLLFGGVFASLGTGGYDPDMEGKPLRKQLVDSFKQIGRSSWSMGKNFALVGAVFSVTECTIEQLRAKSDMYNSMSAGCISGAVLSHKGGPQAMAVGCAGFAAFSFAIDAFMGKHDKAMAAKHDTHRFE